MGTPLSSSSSVETTRDKGDFALYFDEEMNTPTHYNATGSYFAKALDRMDRTYDLIRPYVYGATVLDVGASPFYLLYRAKRGGATRCHGVYFSNDRHPLRDRERIFSDSGQIEISHANVETNGLPFADDEVDVLTACEILEHFDEFPTRLAGEVRRVLRPGGYLAITVPNVCSIANILKLLAQKNIYMKYRSDVTGRHKHEYTSSQLAAFVDYLGMDIVEAGFMPSPTSDKFALRPLYRLIARLPVLRRYSPVLFVLARQRDVKATNDLTVPPGALYDPSLSIED